MELIKKNIDKIRSICKNHKVNTLYVYGSVLTNKYNKNSDIDFLVKFRDVELFYYFENYMSFKENLEKVFKKNIDLLEEQTLKNPYLIASINRNKELIYG